MRSRAGIQRGLSERVGALEFLVQMTHSVVIDWQGEHASARTVVNEVARNADSKSGLFILVVYTDNLSRQAGRWGFDRRSFEFLYLDTAPLAGAAFAPRQDQPG